MAAPPSGSNAAGAAAAAAAYLSPNGLGVGGEHAHPSVSENPHAQEPLKLINSPPKTSKHHGGEQPSFSQYSQHSQHSSLSQDAVASVSSLPTSPSAKSALTAQQRERMEANRLRALERKRQKQMQMQMQRAEENRRRALATKEDRQLKRSVVAMSDNHAKKPREESSNMDSSKAKDNSDDLKLPPIQRKVDGVTLSDEQYQIVARARPPPRVGAVSKRHLVRITAAAGTGKTTTLIRLALRCIELGHDHLTYVTYSRASADDAKRRIEAALLASSNFGSQQQRHPIIHAATLHSCAQQLNNEAREAATGGKLLDEEDFKQLILNVCGEDIERYLAEADRYIEAGGGGGEASFGENRSSKPSAEMVASRKRRARQQVQYFIYKTFTDNFAHKKRSFEEFQNQSDKWRHFHTVKTGWHSAGGKGDREFGFPYQHYASPSKYRFYADMACRVWEFVESQDLRSHDIEMKRAQLNKFQIRGTVLLVDECQDLDGAQIDWVHHQAELYGTQVYFVGDAAQTIYYFRGARSRYLMGLKKATDLSLTTSFRFGPSIARAANTILFAKENSAQTPGCSSGAKTWNPYRIQTDATKHCVVTDSSILPFWREKQITLIGYSNGGLMMAAMAAMGMGSLLQVDEGDEDGSENEGEGRYDTNVKEDNTLTSDRLPKICINGKGGNSGINKWRQTIKQITTLYQLFLVGHEGMQLPATFPEFENQPIAWDAFKKDVEAREIAKYASSIQVIDAYGSRTNEAITFFEEEVIAKRFSDDEADIVLTTCHSAKGMEWDNCQVLDEFVDLFSFTDKDNDKKEVDHSTFDSPLSPLSQDFDADAKRKGETRNKWQFDVHPYDDSLNLLYVACTRAKKVLSIPEKLRKLYTELDSLTSWVNSWQATFNNGGEDLSLSVEDEDNIYVNVKKDNRNLNKKEACQLYGDVCNKLRIELGLNKGETFLGRLVTGLELENGEEK